MDSKRNVLIQLADMIAEAINRSYNEKKEDRNLYNEIIQKRKGSFPTLYRDWRARKR